MKRYPEYKDSEVEWIGEIPVSWEMTKVKFLAALVIQKAETSIEAELKIALENIEGFTGKCLNGTGSFEGVGCYFKKGDVLFNKLRPYLAKVFLAPSNGISVGELLVLRPMHDSVSTFLFYRFLSKPFISVVDGASYGAKMPRANWDLIANLKVPVPERVNQEIIGKYLNYKTHLIDTLIKKKRKQIELLQEQRAAIINHAVTKGLNPNVKMKDSGIEWIGEVPYHWEIKRLKWLIRERLKYGANESAELNDVSLPRYIRITDFSEAGTLRDNTFRSLPWEKATDYMLNDGDILFARSGATVGKTFQFKNYPGRACYAGYLIKATPDQKKMESDFLYYFTRTSCYENWKNSIFIQATIQNIGADKYQNLSVPVPSLHEQVSIVDFVKSEAARIQRQIDIIRKSIQLLSEYRTTLISEVVTGKIDVREEAVP